MTPVGEHFLMMQTLITVEVIACILEFIDAAT